MFRIHAGTAPAYLCEGFARVNSVHRYETRGSHTDFFVPRGAGTQFINRGFFYLGIRDWNALPAPLKKCERDRVFKDKLKEYFLSFY